MPLRIWWFCPKRGLALKSIYHSFNPTPGIKNLFEDTMSKIITKVTYSESLNVLAWILSSKCAFILSPNCPIDNALGSTNFWRIHVYGGLFFHCIEETTWDKTIKFSGYVAFMIFMDIVWSNKIFIPGVGVNKRQKIFYYQPPYFQTKSSISKRRKYEIYIFKLQSLHLALIYNSKHQNRTLLDLKHAKLAKTDFSQTPPSDPPTQIVFLGGTFSFFVRFSKNWCQIAQEIKLLQWSMSLNWFEISPFYNPPLVIYANCLPYAWPIDFCCYFGELCKPNLRKQKMHTL